MFEKIKGRLRGKGQKGLTWQDDSRPSSFSAGPMCFSDRQVYDSAFASISRIAESFAEVLPYAVDERGEKLKVQPQLIRALYNPNEEMSATDFFETLITMLLVHPAVYILLWRKQRREVLPGGPVTPDNIAGFTFLQGAAVMRSEGKTTYLYDGKTYTNRDVISLSLNVNPYNVLGGYSPSQAVKKWATVDDYIAEYQAATFRNDARPAGEMIITAPSVEAYNEAVDRLQAAHRGPNHANNIVYTHRPTSQIDGKPMAAGVEWVPFAQSNKDLTLDSLFNQANKKLDMAYGVPEEVKGYLQNSNYASAEVAQYVFQRYVVYPKLVKVYSKLTHELNRATGGLGFSLDFDYALPVLTDTRKVQADSLKTLLDAGFSVESAVDALQLPASFKKLEEGYKGDEALEVVDTSAPAPSQAATLKAVKATRRKSAPRAADTGASATLRTALETYIAYLFAKVADGISNDETDPLEAVETVSNIVETDQNAQSWRLVILGTLYLLLGEREQVAFKGYSKLLKLNNVVNVLDVEELDKLATELQQQVTNAKVAIEAGKLDYDMDVTNINAITNELTEILERNGLTKVIPDIEDADTYPKQINALLVLFAAQRLDALKGQVALAETATEARQRVLTAASEADFYVRRWADSEQHRAEELGGLLAAEEAGEIAELKPFKTWHINPASPDVCPECIAMNGQTVPVSDTYSNGDMVPHYHPNCYCTTTVDFRKKEPTSKSVKITCPHCGRYMMESSGGDVTNVICANSKCKRHYDFKVAGGEITATERKA